MGYNFQNAFRKYEGALPEQSAYKPNSLICIVNYGPLQNINDGNSFRHLSFIKAFCFWSYPVYRCRSGKNPQQDSAHLPAHLPPELCQR